MTPCPRAASRGLVLASRHPVVGPGLGLVRFLRRVGVARAAHMVALMLRLIFTLARFVAVISTSALTMFVSHLVTPPMGPIWPNSYLTPLSAATDALCEPHALPPSVRCSGGNTDKSSSGA